MSALLKRFCTSWRICDASASIAGNVPTSIRPPVSAMAVSRSATTSRAIAARLVGANGRGVRLDLRIRQQIGDQRAHARRGVEHPVEVLARVALEERSSRRAQSLAERHDLAQRLLQVVRCDERELVQRRVRSLELAALNGEESLGEPSLGHVFDRQKNQP